MADEKLQIKGLVLAGGYSKRMRADKALLSYYGVTQLEHCVRLLGGFCQEVRVSVRQEQAAKKTYAQFACLADRFSVGGPINGILTAFNFRNDVPWLVLACDLPFVDEQVIAHLIKNRNSNAVATVYESNKDYGMPEPLCGIYEPKAHGIIEENISKQLYCPRKILLNCDVHMIKQIKRLSLDNANTKQEYQKAFHIIRQRT